MTDLKDIYPEYLHEFVEYLQSHNTESARGQVLVACSFIDEQLLRSLDNFFIKDVGRDRLLNGFNAPIGTFASRILMMRALGLITKAEFQECETVRKIRNHLAHSHTSTFEDDRIRDLCRNLTLSVAAQTGTDQDAQGMFSTSAIALINRFYNRPHWTEKVRLEDRQWPDWPMQEDENGRTE